MPRELGRHTKALPPPSRWERFCFRLFGRWPQSVVNRRLDAAAADQIEARIAPWREHLQQARQERIEYEGRL